MAQETIIQANLLDEYKKDYIRYALTVCRVRAVPDVRDGLKTVHRRILLSMLMNNFIKDKVKSIKIVGSVLGEYHPHGDAAVYNAMKPMVNDFEIKVPLIDGQGNFGSFQGDGAAASRYTEAKMSKFALDCVIGDMKYIDATAEWRPNFDDSKMEVAYMPATVPLLLINGAFGIAVGMKVEIPKHNLNEVVDATLKLIADPTASVELIPDHCMPVEILDANFKSISNKGFGHYSARAIIDIENLPNGKQQLVIKSLPDMVFLDNITGRNDNKKKGGAKDSENKSSTIESLIMSKTIQVDDMYDESSSDALRYVIVLKKGADAEYTREVLYRNTQLEKRYTVNFHVLKGIDLIRYSYKDYLLEFIEFRKLVKFIRYSNQYQEVATKFHEKDAFIKVMQSDQIDTIINMIRNQDQIDDSILIEYLVRTLDITDLQAKFIIDVNLKRLSNAYLDKYIEEAKHYASEMQFYMNKIVNEEETLKDIIDELIDAKNKYGKPRTSIVVENKKVSMIPKGDFKIIITENNYIKKIPANVDFSNIKQDKIRGYIKGCNTEAILIFDDRGRVYRLPISKIPIHDKSGSGDDIRTLVKTLTSNIVKIIYEPKMIELSKSLNKYFMTTLSREGNIKKMDLDDFMNIPASGTTYMKLDSKDNVIAVNIIEQHLDIVVFSPTHALRVNMSEVQHQRRTTMGLKAMATDLPLDGMSVISPDSTDVIVVTEKGYVNMFDIVALPRAVRNKPGASVIKLGRGDKIRSILNFHMDDNKFLKIMLSSNDEINIQCSSIQKGSSISPGDKLIPIKNNSILSAAIVEGF